MLSVKIAALTNTSAEGHLRRFLLDGERLSPEEPALAMLSLSELIADVPDFAIGHYLLGRQLFSRDEHERAIVYLERARSLDLDSETLMAENTRLLAISYFYLGQFGRARELFMSLADDQTRPLGARVLASDWVERCDWEAGQGERAE
jgi:tetratricopeptide (TPR) repeat protein